MKYLPFIITGVVSVVISLTGDWVIRVYLLRETVRHAPAAVVVNPNPAPPSPYASRPSVNEWQEFQSARGQALRDNPDLAAEYQELRGEIQQQQKDVETAMIKADPKVALILAKLDSFRRGAVPSGDSSSGPNNGTATR